MKRFKLIFFMSLILILILGTSSQASVSKEYVEYTFTHFQNTIDLALDTGNNSYMNNVKNILNTLTNQDYNAYTLQLNQLLEEKNLQDLTNHNMTTFLSYDNSKNSILMYFVFSNTSAPNNVNNLGFLRIKRNATFSIYISCNGNNNDKIYFIELRIFNTQNSSFSQIKTLTNSAIQQIPYMKSATLNSNNTVLTLSNVSCTNTQSIYYHVPFGVNASNVYIPGFISGLTTENDPGYFEIQTPQPPQPSGEGGSGNTGTIDLSKIESGIDNINNSINNQGQNIINNQNQNTDKIIANQNQNNQEVTQRLDDINSYDKNAIDNVVQGYLSGDYNASSSILALNDAFFHSSDDGDLVIEWEGINYLGVSLIPQGSFNFTEFVSTDEQITKIYNYYKMFATASFGIILIAAYYNLALSVLGLGSYFAMNTDTEEETTSDLGNSSPQLESTEEYYTRKFKHESNMRYNKRG